MKYAFIILLISLISVSLEAAQELKYILNSSVLQDGTTKIEIDLNLDGKVDRIENYKNDQLISIKRDTKFNGNFDENISYFDYMSPDKAIEVIQKDTNGDKKIDRIETIYRDPVNLLTIVTTEVDSKFSGIFDKKWTSTSALIEKKDQVHCIGNINLENLKILKLSNDVNTVKNSLNGGFSEMNSGYKIHQSCLAKWGGDMFPKLLTTSMNKGFQCLAKLAKNNAKSNPGLPNGAYNNLKGLDFILKTKGISIVCNEKKYDWSKTAAHASTGPNDVIEESGVKHPFISINETEPKTKLKPTKDEVSELAMTLFHEQLHNLGIRHGESIEFPYTCETCCIKEPDGKVTADACKICGGAYSGINDKNYLKDLMAWGKSSYQGDRSAAAIIKFQKEFPHDRFGLFAYANASSGIFSPVGIELGKILKQKFKVRTSEEERFLKNSEEYQNVDSVKAAAPYSILVAQSHLNLYYDENPKKTLDQLEANKGKIINLLSLAKNTKNDDKYIYKNISQELKDLLFDIWMKNYPKVDGPDNNRAYKILKDTGMV
jgi:hypothetical protein